MASQFPTAVDSFPSRIFGQTVASTHMNEAQDGIEAVQAKVGKDGDADQTTLDYLVKSKQNPGHTHTGASLSDIAESDITDGMLLARVADAESITGVWTFSTMPVFGTATEWTAGESAIPTAGDDFKIGAGGGSPNAATFAWGDNTGWKLRLGTNVSSAFSERFTFMDTGEMGIGLSTPHAPLQFAAATANRKIVLYEQGNNDHQFWGFGVNSNTLRFQVADQVAGGWSFHAATSSSVSYERMRLTGDGQILLTNDNGTAPSSWPSGSGGSIFSAISSVSGKQAIDMEYYADSTAPAKFTTKRSRGTPGSHTPVLDGDIIGALRFQGQGETSPTTPAWALGATIEAITTENWSASTNAASLKLKTAASGGVTVDRMVLGVGTDGQHIGVGVDPTDAPIRSQAATQLGLSINGGDDISYLELGGSASSLMSQILFSSADLDGAPADNLVGALNVHVTEADAASSMQFFTRKASDSGVSSVVIFDTAQRALFAKSVATTQGTVILGNGANHDVAIDSSGYCIILGPTAAYSITGFAGGVDGQRLVVQSAVPYDLTFSHQTGSAVGSRIYIYGTTSLVLDGDGTNGGGIAEFIYDGLNNVWLLMNARGSNGAE